MGIAKNGKLLGYKIIRITSTTITWIRCGVLCLAVRVEVAESKLRLGPYMM